MKSKISLLLIISLFLVLKAYSQTVSYSYKPFAAEGCYVSYSVVKQDSTYYVIAKVRSDRMMFPEKSTMQLKSFDGEIIKLDGTLVDNGSQSTDIISGNMVIPVTEIHSIAQFAISEDQLEHFQNGISKIRLTTIPIVHERTFKKDKIGRKLYQFYIKQKDTEF